MTGNAENIKKALESADNMHIYICNNGTGKMIADILAYGQSMAQQKEPDRVGLATAAMQGILANRDLSLSYLEVAEQSVHMANELIKALKQTP